MGHRTGQVLRMFQTKPTNGQDCSEQICGRVESRLVSTGILPRSGYTVDREISDGKAVMLFDKGDRVIVATAYRNQDGFNVAITEPQLPNPAREHFLD